MKIICTSGRAAEREFKMEILRNLSSLDDLEEIGRSVAVDPVLSKNAKRRLKSILDRHIDRLLDWGLGGDGMGEIDEGAIGLI